MEKNGNNLRKKAEKIIEQRKNTHSAFEKGDNIEKVLEELSVYQIELEIQNEELRQQQERIQESKKQYQDLFDNAPVGYVIIDKDFVIRNCNKTFSHQIKQSIGTLINNKFNKFIHPDYQDKVYLTCKKLFKEKNSAFCEFILRSGSDHEFHARLDAVHYDEKEDELARLAISDISFRMEQEKEIRKNQEKITDQNKKLLASNDELAKQSALMASQYEDLLALNEEVAALNEELRVQNEDLQSTNMKLNELAQKLSLERNRAQHYLDIAGTMIIALDSKGKIMLANKKASEILGYSEKEMLGKDWFEHFSPASKILEVKKQFRDIITGKANMNELGENEVATKNKGVRIVLWFNSLIKDGNGNITGVLSSGEDVTEIREKDKELKKIEWLLSPKNDEPSYKRPGYGDLSTLNKDGLILNSVGKEVLENIVSDYLSLLETSAAIYEKNGDYALGIFSSNWCSFLDDASRKLCKNCNNAEALNSGQWHCHESCWQDASLQAINKKCPVEIKCNGGLKIYAIPIMVDKKVIGAINFGHGDPPKDEETLKDISSKYKVSIAKLKTISRQYETRPAFIIDLAKERLDISAKLIAEMVERKQVNIALQDSQRKYMEIFNGSRDGFVMVDLNEKIIDCNKAYIKMLGYTFEELNSKNTFYEITPKKWRDWEREEIWEKKLLKKHYSGIYEKEYIRKNGTIFPVEMQSYAVTDKFGNIDYLWGIARDITNRKATENELIKSKEKAEESDRLKTAFLANMSHEIRTPMNGILGFAELLKEPELTKEQLNKYIQVIEESGYRMLNTINDIIDISKIEAGQMDICISKTNINDEIISLYNFFKPETEKKGLDFNYVCPLEKKETYLKTDKAKLFAILSNLLKNAIKYTHRGKIEFGYKKKNDFIEFYVEDTGIGIAGHKQEHIFERFIQEEYDIIHSYEGSGLGLAISKAYVEMLGGNIGLKSVKNKGSNFFFTIPFETTGESQNNRIKKTQEQEQEKEMKKDLNILIAEDIESSDALLTEMLKKNSKTILHAKTGKQAIELCKKHPELELILMDIKMPEMNGHEATQEIRKFNKDIVIIAQTAYALHGDRENALEAGCNDYITKPIKKEELMEMIEKHVG